MLYKKGKKTVVRGVIYNSDDHILVVRRTENHTLNPGLWEPPGGKLDEDELKTGKKRRLVRPTLIKALAREILEETGLEVTDVGGFNEVDGYYMDNDIRNGLYVCYAALTRVRGTEIVLNLDEHDDFRWQDPLIPTNDITPATANAFTMFNEFGLVLAA